MADKKKKTLTESEEALIDTVAENWIQRALFNQTKIDHEKAVGGIDFIYSLADLKPPQIIICEDPMDLFIAAKEAGAEIEKGTTFDYSGLGYDSGWTAFYEYFQKIGIDLSDLDFNKWLTFLDSGIWASLFYENAAFVCAGPSKIHLNKDNNLHNETGMAIEWPSGWGLYFLNGVGVEDEIVTTPAEKLDPTLIQTEKNAEVRREIVRKIGIERIIQKLGGKTLDSWQEYELIELPQIEGMRTRALYLKMKNPSINTYHIEGVSPDCKTVQDALHFRKPEAMRSIPIDEKNGLDYYQQGDVIVWPKGAKSLKSYPSILT
jgi:hypothetical protein